MAEFRDDSVQGIPGKVTGTLSTNSPATGAAGRRGKRVNSCVPVSMEWSAGGASHCGEARTRVVGPYGCLVIHPQALGVKQQLQLTNLVSRQSNAAVVVWQGKKQPDGWELGIELINPAMDFWGLEL